MELICGFCFYGPDREKNTAITIINGHAVCEDHEWAASQPKGGDFLARLSLIFDKPDE